MDGTVVDMVKNIVQVQKSQYDTFIQERLIDRSKLITDPIKTEQSAFAQNIEQKMPILGKGSSIIALKKDIALSSPILYIACPSRDGNLDESFKHENQPWLPALSQMN